MKRDPSRLKSMSTVKLPCYCATLRQASRVLTSFYDERLHRSGISITQFTILQALDILESARILDLERALAMDQTTLTRNLALMSRRGLVKVVARPSGREKCWGMTAEGRKAFEHALPLWQDAQAEVIRRSGARNLQALHQDVFELITAFS
jgi:DNA-binding MarR family transcriptional regulator